MKKNRSIWMLTGIAVLLLHACAIPKTTIKETEVDLPAEYQDAASDSSSAATINWRDLFGDPYLVDLIDSALTGNKELYILLQRMARSQNEIMAREGEYQPFVNAGFGADADKVGRYTRNGAVEESLEIEEGKAFPKVLTNFELGLFASWELDVWKKLRNARKVAVLEYLSSIEGRNFVITSLVAEIAEAYYELIGLDNQLDNLNQNIAIQQDAFEVVKLLQQSGRENSLAVKRFEAEVQKNRSEIYAIRQKITETENHINFLIGRSPRPIRRMTGSITEKEPVLVNAGLPSQLLLNRPDVRKAELELQARKLNIDVARANFYPSFDLRAGLGYEAFNPKFMLSTPESMAIGLAGEIVAPLVNRKAIKAEYLNANAMQIEAAYEYEQTILNAYREVANQISNIRNLESSYSLKQQQVDALINSIEIANQLFQSARADYMEVLLTQRDALEARTELIELKKEMLVSSVQLYKALGGGWQ